MNVRVRGKCELSSSRTAPSLALANCATTALRGGRPAAATAAAAVAAAAVAAVAVAVAVGPCGRYTQCGR